jgi:hypothetical protein
MYHTPKIVHNCVHPRKYSERYDAYYCPECDLWSEGRCGDPDCDFCNRRPERPSLEEKEDPGNKK